MKRRTLLFWLEALAAAAWLGAAPNARAAGPAPSQPTKPHAPAKIPTPAPAPVPPPGPRAGTSIKIVVRAGALSVEQVGRIVPCTRDAVCAVLPSGKHVEGRVEDGRLIVELP
jgi:hypothetical protein